MLQAAVAMNAHRTAGVLSNRLLVIGGVWQYLIVMVSSTSALGILRRI